MAEVVYLDCTFQFEKDQAWSNIYEFDRDLAKFLRGLGLKGNVVEPIKGMPGRRFIYIEKMKKDLLENPNQNWQEKGRKK